VVIHFASDGRVFGHSYGDSWRPGTPALIGTSIHYSREVIMRSILLFMLGVPIPVIILIALFWH
jgi:hypothetical protein